MLIKYMGAADTRNFKVGDTLNGVAPALPVAVSFAISANHILDTTAAGFSGVNSSWWTALLGDTSYFRDVTSSGAGPYPPGLWDQIYGVASSSAQVPSPSIGSVVVSGTPTAGQVPVADSATAAHWGAASSSGVASVAAGSSHLTASTASGAVTVDLASADKIAISLANTAVQPSSTLFTTIGSSQQSGSYTLVLTDAGTVVEGTGASAANLTIPPNSSVSFPLNTYIEVHQYGAGQLTIVAGSGVTLRYHSPTSAAAAKTAAQYATVGLRQRATNEWVVAGDLA